MEWEDITGMFHPSDIKDGCRLYQAYLNDDIRLLIKYEPFWKHWYIVCAAFSIDWSIISASSVEEAKESAVMYIRDFLHDLIRSLD